jgi:hypothetical protein
MITSVHHAQITIPLGTEVKAREYYCVLLGLREIAKPQSLTGRGGFWMQFGEFQIHVGTEDGFDRLHTKAHLAYQVSSLSEMRSILTSAGYEVLEGIPVPGMIRFESRDPFGNRIEFLELTNDLS